MGLADLFVVANRIAEGIDQIPSRLRVRHLRTGKGADPAPAFDTDPDTAMNHTGPSDVLVLPPSLEAPISTDVAAPPRPEESRVGKECVRQYTSRGCPYHYK